MSEQPKIRVLVSSSCVSELVAALQGLGVVVELMRDDCTYMLDHGVNAAEGIEINGRLVAGDDNLHLALEQLADPLYRDLKKAESSIDFGDVARGLAAADAPFHHQLNQPLVVRHEKGKSASTLAVLCTLSENEYDPQAHTAALGGFFMLHSHE